MRLVSDGETYGILHGSSDGMCRLREVPEGTVTTRPCSGLTPVAPAEIAAGLTSRNTFDSRDHSGQALALLLELEIDGPASARQLLERFDVCESDLHGVVSELRAARLIKPTTVYSERGYRTTPAAHDMLSVSER